MPWHPGATHPRGPECPCSSRPFLRARWRTPQRPPPSSAPRPVTSSWGDVESGWHAPLLRGYTVLAGSPGDAVTYSVPFHGLAFGVLSHPGGAAESVGSQSASQTLGVGRSKSEFSQSPRMTFRQANVWEWHRELAEQPAFSRAACLVTEVLVCHSDGCIHRDPTVCRLRAEPFPDTRSGICRHAGPVALLLQMRKLRPDIAKYLATQAGSLAQKIA